MMKKYKSLASLINAKAMKQHKANLARGGVFDKHGKRTSNYALEMRLAKKEVLSISSDNAEDIIGVKLSKSAKRAKYIRNVGYVEYKTE